MEWNFDWRPANVRLASTSLAGSGSDGVEYPAVRICGANSRNLPCVPSLALAHPLSALGPAAVVKCHRGHTCSFLIQPALPLINRLADKSGADVASSDKRLGYLG